MPIIQTRISTRIDTTIIVEEMPIIQTRISTRIDTLIQTTKTPMSKL
jgi:hypothetical protein